MLAAVMPNDDGKKRPHPRPGARIDPTQQALRAVLTAGGFVRFTVQRFLRDRCFSDAASLSYTTLLAIVPLTAVGFAIFSAFPAFEGLSETLQTFLFKNFVPAAGDVVRQNIAKFIANTGQLTAIGVVFLAVTSLLLLNTIEESFNVIWRQTRPRPVLIRVLTYWAILTLTPLLLGGSFALSSYIFALTEVLGTEAFSGPAGALVRAAPFALSAIGFTLLYVIMPSRRIRWSHAIAGGLVATVLFQILKFGFALYVTNFPSYQTIYGAVAAMPLFLVWMYLGWCAVLVGAEFAAAIPEWRHHRRQVKRAPLDPAARLTLAVGLLAALHAAARSGATLDDDALALAAHADPEDAEEMIDWLIVARYAMRTDEQRLMLGRDLAATSLHELAEALGLAVTAGPPPGPSAPDWRRRLAAVIAEADRSGRAALSAPIRDVLEAGAGHRESPAAKAKRPG